MKNIKSFFFLNLTPSINIQTIYKAILGTARVLELDLTQEDDIETALAETYEGEASKILHKLYPNTRMNDILSCFADDISKIHSINA
jgi:hypothetical protein